MQPPYAPKNAAYKTHARHRRLGYLIRVLRNRPAGVRPAPVLATFPGRDADARPPVRIFIGTESGQAEAERVLVWSILKHRDPDRSYEIHLMKRIAGFERRLWKTGFTNYRYAIPHFAGAAGRAIYNDVDQIYLADPAELFDLPLEGAGACSVDGRDTSVMLLDCARMALVWPLARARASKAGHPDYRALRDAHDLWGPLAPEWNARDGAYRAGATKLAHFTTLHTQPWRPFPEELRYEPHPDAEAWFALQREADRAGFTVFTAERPSLEFTACAEAAATAPPQPAARAKSCDLKRLARLLGAGADPGAPSLLVLEFGRRLEGLETTGAAVEPHDPLTAEATPAPRAFDVATAPETLHLAPEDDAPWLLDLLFRSARRHVYVSVAPANRLPLAWWRRQMEAAARRTPGVAWTLRRRGATALFPAQFAHG